MLYVIADMTSLEKEISLNRTIMIKHWCSHDSISLVTPETFPTLSIETDATLLFYFIRTYAHASTANIIPILKKLVCSHTNIYFYIEDFYRALLFRHVVEVSLFLRALDYLILLM